MPEQPSELPKKQEKFHPLKGEIQGEWEATTDSQDRVFGTGVIEILSPVEGNRFRAKIVFPEVLSTGSKGSGILEASSIHSIFWGTVIAEGVYKQEYEWYEYEITMEVEDENVQPLKAILERG